MFPSHPTSSSQGAPKEVPLSIWALSAAFTSSLAWPTMAGPQEPTTAGGSKEKGG